MVNYEGRILRSNNCTNPLEECQAPHGVVVRSPYRCPGLHEALPLSVAADRCSNVRCSPS
eukprot:6720766-Prymnesium_polylepis.1